VKKRLQQLVINLRSGWSLAVLHNIDPDRVGTGGAQLAMLFFVNTGLAVALDYLRNQPDAQFNPYALTAHGFQFAALLFGAALGATLLRRRKATLMLTVLVLAFMPLFQLTAFALQLYLAQLPDPPVALGYGLYYVLLGWYLLVLLWALRVCRGSWSWRVGGALMLLLAGFQLPSWYFTSYTEFWYSLDEESGADAYAAYRDLDAETMLYRQAEQLGERIDALAGQRAGVTDLYFIGFAGYARESVFRKEVEYAQKLFDSRFDTRQRSLSLINHIDTWQTEPLATGNNLRIALQRIAQRMDTEQDILVLFLTSHGSRNHELSVDFWPLPLNDLTPAMLRQYLDEAGIKWRVLIVSACYSGGFIEPLASPYSWIATAAAENRTSFGCSDHNDFTYFGEALLRDQLASRTSFTGAFHRAALAIEAREKGESLDNSLPQLFVGDAMRDKLATFETELVTRLCREDATGYCSRACGETPAHC
jgi:hypothetical protein